MPRKFKFFFNGVAYQFNLTINGDFTVVRMDEDSIKVKHFDGEMVEELYRQILAEEYGPSALILDIEFVDAESVAN